VVVTGGARGVTAAVVIEMAKRWKPSLLLLGRSPLHAEPAWAQGIESAQLKAACMGDARANGQKLSPKDLDQRVNAILANREVETTLKAIREAGASVEYAAVDARDPQAVGLAIHRFDRPIVGIVHGAGVLADRLVMDKTLDQFQAVFGTKVDGLNALLSNIDIENLKMVALFGSVAGRFGNRGQCDYAMANEVLSKTGERLAHLGVPHVKCFAWGPWEGGMVTPALKKQFEASGMELISLDGGARLFCEELESDSGVVEIVVGGPETGGPLISPERPNGAKDLFLHPARDPFLSSHQINGKAVLPLAMVLEWMAATARTALPSLKLRSIRQFQVLRGVVLEAPDTLRLSWSEVDSPASGIRSLKLELTSGGSEAIRHYQAFAEMGTAPGALSPVQLADPPQPSPISVKEAYRQHLFHGPAFRGIEAIHSCTPEGISAFIGGFAPSQLGSSEPWSTDPMTIDNGLQLMLLWARQQRGSAALPMGIEEFIQAAPFPRDGVVCRIHMLPTRTAGGKFNASFEDKNGRVVATIRGGGYAINAALNDTFQSLEA